MTTPAGGIRLRWATADDLPAIRSLMALAIDQLQAEFLAPAQVAASRAIMGLDTQLVADGTYLLAEADADLVVAEADAGSVMAAAGRRLVGCGGWSRRATLYGGDHSRALREPALLDPARDAARIRAMYTHPHHVRRGIGRLVLARCEQAARAAGFGHAELMATMSGKPLYLACGYRVVETAEAVTEGVAVPLARMRKALDA